MIHVLVNTINFNSNVFNRPIDDTTVGILSLSDLSMDRRGRSRHQLRTVLKGLAICAL